MKYYQDITLLPDTETNLGFLWHKIYQQVHIALADNKQADGTSKVAVSIPEYKAERKKAFPLGSKLRLISEKEELQSLDIEKWLLRLTDYCHVKPIKPVPDVVQYACFYRQAVKSVLKRAEKLTKHLNEKNTGQNKTVDEVFEYLVTNNNAKESNLPFITLESQSTSSSNPSTKHPKHKYRIFIKRTIGKKSVVGSFTCYGLSSRIPDKQATVPWFE